MSNVLKPRLTDYASDVLSLIPMTEQIQHTIGQATEHLLADNLDRAAAITE